MNKVLLVGGGGREDAVARRIVGSGGILFSCLKNRNPSIIRLSRKFLNVDELNHEAIVKFAIENRVDIAFIGPDPVLETPLAEELLAKGVRVASPDRRAAIIETSKEFLRGFMARNRIPGDVENWVFRDEPGLDSFFRDLDFDVAVKPIGLTGGKGVRVMGVQLKGKEEALDYARSVIRKDGVVLIEKRLVGEEFSLQAFTDGINLVPMPLAQDYKRALEGDLGPNTGGMGSITDRDHLLPFVNQRMRDRAVDILKMIVNGLRKEGRTFRGILYGQFMTDGNEPRVVEINARFADPEGINVMSLYEGDFMETLYGISDGNLKSNFSFRGKATVLKYIVPQGYGISPRPSVLRIDEMKESESFRYYYAQVSGTVDEVVQSTSRSLALVGIADSIPEASDIVEGNLGKIRGEFYVRHDIGSREMLKIKMDRLRAGSFQ
ncbi:phosphoribosylamine--glycine ligase [Thermoplasmatales archaeon AK]|nr:phosphoribosylamine--glycine ligase [Thermoplasmatales archaeon AK]